VTEAATQAGRLTAALVLDGVRWMTDVERNELRALLGLDGPPEIELDHWMDSRAAAEYLGVHRDTLRKLAATGAVPSEQDGSGSKRYFRQTALDRWREGGTLPRGFHASKGRASAGD
jgi:excisionase family DNA binding protein